MPRNLFAGLENAFLCCDVSLYEAVYPRIRYYACGLAREFSSWFPSFEQEDLVQEGVLTFWKWFDLYVWICPICDCRRENIDHYKAHVEIQHGTSWVDPKTIFTSWVSHKVKIYMKSYCRKFIQPKRDRRKLVDCDGSLDQIEDKSFSPESATVSLSRASFLRKLLEEEADGRIRVAVEAWLEGLEGPQVHRRLVEEGFYNSVASARTFVCQAKKKGSFDSYRVALCS